MSRLELDAAERMRAFRRLHESGTFVIPNPWDAGSAVCLAGLGFQALATTSAGLAFARGKPDTVDALGCDEVLANVRGIVEATALPVSADFQSGYAPTAEGVGASVARCIATGVAGLSIEDATGRPEQPLFERRDAIERLRAARRAIDESGGDVLLTGRCEAWLVGDPDPLRTALDRLVAYADAGADCLFAPGVTDAKEISAIVKAVHPKPVNVIVASARSGLTVARLRDLGVRRVSVGSALARVALGAFLRSAAQIFEEGRFDTLASAASFDELNAIFGAG
jgi:2-methylisocitrate lyase-like PEP mutase family enzyme